MFLGVSYSCGELRSVERSVAGCCGLFLSIAECCVVFRSVS